MRKMVVGKGHLGCYIASKFCLSEEMHWKGAMDELTIDKLRGVSPDVVINTAGKTDLPWCENNPHEAFSSNVIGPIALYRRCNELSIKFVHLSSGCVWDGPYNKDGKPFRPIDPVTPACFYAWTKAICDSVLVQESNSVLIIRARQLYSPINSPRNSLIKLKAYNNLLDTPNSMTSADTIVKTIEVMLKTKINAPLIMNVYDKGVTTPYEVAKFLYEAGLREAPGLLDKHKLDQWHKPRRVDTVLYDSTFEHFVQPPLVQDELRRVIGELKKNV